MNKENLKFISRVAVTHITTYILCGIIFSSLFNYEQLYSLENARNFMRPLSGTSTIIGPFVQVIRGLLFGVILLFMRSYFTGRYGWLKLWGIIVTLGIINTPAPAPFSIEGLIYTQLPLEFHLKGAPEILTQILLFSYLIAKPKKEKQHSKFVEQNRIPLIASIMAGIGFSLSGMVLTLILKVDIMAGTKDIGAFIIMFAAMLLVFLATKWYCSKAAKPKAMILTVVYYIALAVMPTGYNFIVNSPFKSLLSLAINVVPVIVMLMFLYFSTVKINRTV